MVTIVAIGVSVTIGLYAAMDSLNHTLDTVYREGELADLEIRFLAEDRQNVPEVRDIDGVEEVETRLIMPGYITLASGRRLPTLVYFLPDEWPQRVNPIRPIDGDSFSPDSSSWCLAERSLAAYHGVRKGDSLRVQVGYKAYEFHVSGVAFSPEYLMSASTGNFLVPEKGALAVVYTSQNQFSQNMGFELVSSISFRFQKGADAVILRKKLESRLSERLQILEVIPKREQFSYRWLSLDLEAYAGFIPVLIVIFGIVGIFATFITFTRMILSNRRGIGTFMALGYDFRHLAFAYLTGGVILACLAFGLGLFISFPLRDLFMSAYAQAIGLYQMYPVMPVRRVLLGGALSFVTVGGAVAISLRYLSTLTPLRALRPVQNGGKRRFSGNLKMGRGFAVTYALRNLVRHSGLSGATVFCIALSLAAVMAYFIALTSLDRTVEGFFRGYPWDLIVDFHTNLWPEDVEELAANQPIDAWEVRVKGHVTFTSEAGEYDSTLIGVPASAALILPPHRIGTQPPDCQKGEVVLETVLARNLRVEPGDGLTLRSGQQTRHVRVVGICAGISGHTSFSRIDYARDVLDIGETSSILIAKASADVEPEDLADRLMQEPDVAYITVQSNIVGSFKALLEEFWVILRIATALSIMVALVFIITTLLLSVMERRDEFATMKVMGVSQGRIGAILITEAMVQMVLGILVALPISIWIAFYLAHSMSSLWFDVHLQPSLANYLVVAIPAIVLSPLSVLPSYRYLVSLDLTDTIRNRNQE